MEPRPGIELRVLGTPELRASDGSDISELLAQPKRLAILTYLAVAKPRGFHRRQVLLALFWPESNEVRARAALRQAVHAVRQRLGDDIIVNRGEDEIAITVSRLWCDATEADEALTEEDFSRAVTLYRGELLPGLSVEGAPGFQDWLDAERTRLRQRIAEAALRAARVSPPGSPVATSMIRRALELAPADETLVRGVMQLHAATDRAAALRVYEQLAETLRKDFGVAPSEATQELAEKLRSGSAGHRATPVGRRPAFDPGAGVTDVAAGRVANAVERPRMARRTLLAAITAAIAIVGVGAGFLWSSGRREVDENAVAVLPFRVTATDSANNYLREGVVDILNAQLTGDGVPRSIDARLVLNAWRKNSGSSTAELTIEEAAGLARGLGAGRVIIGEFVSGPASITLSARMIETATGKVLAHYREATRDDPLRLTNRVLSALLAGSLGEGTERLSRLSDSVLAMKAYLAGMSAYRKGELELAQKRFRAALTVDSSFAPAAFWWSMATPDPMGPIKLTADSALWGLRDRLSRRDRAIVATLWTIGPNYPKASTVTDFLRAYEAAADANPDRPEPWLAWANTLAYYGPQVGIPDGANRSAAILDHALRLDSTLVPVLEARIKWAARIHDTALVRRLSRQYERMVGTDSASAMVIQWIVGLALGDSLQRARAGQRMMQSSLPPLHYTLSHAVWAGISLADLDVVASRRSNPVDRFDLASIRGRQRNALAVAESLPVSGNMQTRSMTTLVTLALVEPGYDDAAARAVNHPLASADTAFGDLFRTYCACYRELWQSYRGKTRNARGVASAIRRSMHGVQGRTLSASIGPLDVCPLLLEFAADRSEGSRQASTTIERLDSLMSLGVGRDLSGVLANFVIAEWKESRGDLRGALAALRRRIPADHRMYYLTAPAYLLAEGRLAAGVGDRDGAIRAYSAFLALRDQPDPGPMQDQVRLARAQLTKLTRPER